MCWFKIVKLRMVVSGATLGLYEEHVLRVQRVLKLGVMEEQPFFTGILVIRWVIHYIIDGMFIGGMNN